MVAGTGAHAHLLIEGVEAKPLTCSGGASSKNLLGRCRKYDVDESSAKGGARSRKVRSVARSEHIQ